jgi:thioredoxin-related protein
MKKIFFCILIFAGFMSWGNTIKAAGNLDWFTSYTEAKKKANEENKFIVVNFTGSDWCTWCKELDKKVFSTSEFKEWSEKNAVLLYLDFPQKIKLTEEQINQNQQIAYLYGITGFPTILIINKYGEVMARTGYMPNPKEWIKGVEDSLTIYNGVLNALK